VAEKSLATTQAAMTELQKTATLLPAPDPTMTDRIARLEATNSKALADTDARLSSIEGQLSSIATMPADGSGVPAAAFAALQQEVRALQVAPAALPADLTAMVTQTESRLAEAQSKAQALAAEVEMASQKNAEAAALGQIEAAMNSGQPFATALGVLPDPMVPTALSSQAAAGVPTLASLQTGFPVAARAALEAALRANMGESWSERIGTFLRSQTGARSLEPREGADPDAVLSRAEAALARGDLDATLTEIAALPATAQTAMADWSGLATQRLDALQALRDLATQMDG
jgi:hypothetical protein